MDSSDAPRSNGATFWDWFLLGAVAGLVYSLLRNPGGCACCGGCLALLVVVAVVLLALLVLEHLLLVSVAVLLAFALWRAWPHLRDRYFAGE